MIEKSVIVSAHPDDEVLWFSSLLDKVDNILICFLKIRTEPAQSAGRKKSLAEYPLSNISCIGLDESETFGGADWQNPLITQYGIEISDKRISDRKYMENYFQLKRDLKNHLAGYRNVFTHNPWGEYGHEDHIQVYRAIKDLQKEMEFNVWFSNYFSNKSFNLMLRYIDSLDSEPVTLKTNRQLGDYIKKLYIKNGCWTWADDWEWFKEESFIKDAALNGTAIMRRINLPMNLIWIDHRMVYHKKKINIEV